VNPPETPPTVEGMSVAIIVGDESVKFPLAEMNPREWNKL